jgi:arginine N-succinyltransferase
MFLIRSVRPKDYRDLLGLSRELNTVNLPSRPADIKKMIERAVQSFAGELKKDKPHAQYLFVLEDVNKGRVIGTSKIFAQHGSPRKPHLYFQVMKERVRSKTLGVHFLRKFYRFRADTHGYTEIGGLVLHPEYRAHPLKLGKQLSYIRFLFMAAHPGFFKKKVIAELLPPIHRGIGSTLYNFYGYKLTRLPYRKADLLSYKNKEFILKLFPKSDLYYDVLPPEVQKDIERTGSGSTLARRLLSKIGFHYANQVDPFDGGPYDVAPLKEIEVIRRTRRRIFGGVQPVRSSRKLLVMTEEKGFVRALLTPAVEKKGKVFLPGPSAELLRVKVGKQVYTDSWS